MKLPEIPLLPLAMALLPLEIPLQRLLLSIPFPPTEMPFLPL
jgi:hypothetical protein